MTLARMLCIMCLRVLFLHIVAGICGTKLAWKELSNSIQKLRGVTTETKPQKTH
jgi:hypothetical protein